MIEPVKKPIVVPCPRHEAFEIFTDQTATWWPLGEHSISAGEGKSAFSVTIEPKIGGMIFEIKHDGTRCDWGTVTSFTPGFEIAMTWHPGSDSAKATHIAVKFQDTEDGKTTVTLIHTGWEVLKEDAEYTRRNYDSGWDFVLGNRYDSACRSWE